MPHDQVRLSPSALLKHDDCPSAYQKYYVERIRTDEESASLVFGDCAHQATTGYIVATALSQPYDIVAVFEAAWDKAVKEKVIKYNSTMGPEDLRATGKALAAQFPGVWASLKLNPLIDEQGPVVERDFSVELIPGVLIPFKPDVVAVDENGDICVPDIKFPASASPENFVHLSDQLTSYQACLESDELKKQLCIDKVSKLGFIEGIKRKVSTTGRGQGPTFATPVIWAPRRTDAQLAEFRTKLAWKANAIRRGEFPRHARAAYNTPCELCDYAKLCINGSMEGLHIKDKSPQVAIGF